MKKTIIWSFIFIVLGFALGSSFYNGTYSSLNEVVKNKNKFYFLQEWVYNSLPSLKKNISNLEQKVIDHKDNNYYVYVGITRDKEVLAKLQKIYKEKGLQLLEKEQTINSEEFINNVEQFDLLIRESSEEDEILAIEEVVLANYEEVSG